MIGSDHAPRERSVAEIRKERFLLFGLSTSGVASEALYLRLVRFNAIDGLRPVATFMGFVMALFAIYGLAFFLLRKIRLRAKAALAITSFGAVLFRITMLPAGLPPDASIAEMRQLVRDDLHGTSVSFDRYLLYDDDIWRYLWDGHVWANSVNPFLYAPVDSRMDPLVTSNSATRGSAHFWDDIRDNINHPRIPTIYPPLAQVVFRISHALAPGSVIVLKTILVILDLITISLLWFALPRLRLPAAWLLLYAWNPLLIKTVAGSGHVDVLAVATLALTVYFLLIRAKLPAALALAAACLAKLSPLILLPFAVKRIGWRNSITAAFVILAAYLPFLERGTAIFSGLSRFAREWQFNSGFFLAAQALARPFTHDPSLAARGTGLIAIVVTAVWLWRQDDGQVATFPHIASHLLAALILFSPTVMPWYLVWLLPLAVMSRTAIWIWFTGLVCLALFVMVDGTERLPVLAIEYGSLLVVALAVFWHRKNLHGQRLSQQTTTSLTSEQTLFTTLRSEIRIGETV